MLIDPKIIFPVRLQYIDMGTAALLIQLAIAGVVGGFYWARSYWERIKEYCKRIFKRD